MCDNQQWQDMKEQRVVLKPVTQAQQLLLKLKRIVEGMIEKDVSRKAAVQAHLHRKKHGGGA